MKLFPKSGAGSGGAVTTKGPRSSYDILIGGRLEKDGPPASCG